MKNTHWFPTVVAAGRRMSWARMHEDGSGIYSVNLFGYSKADANRVSKRDYQCRAIFHDSFEDALEAVKADLPEHEHDWTEAEIRDERSTRRFEQEHDSGKFEEGW